jgi:hypothetical protein
MNFPKEQINDETVELLQVGACGQACFLPLTSTCRKVSYACRKQQEQSLTGRSVTLAMISSGAAL